MKAERKLLWTNGTEREGDAFVRIRNSLFVCECRSIDRPLDYEIGIPKTIEHRSKILKEKVEQVSTLAMAILHSPKGHNFDFSWADQIEGIVVSPHVEWIWTLDPTIWLDTNTPRILSAEETVNFLKQY